MAKPLATAMPTRPPPTAASNMAMPEKKAAGSHPNQEKRGTSGRSTAPRIHTIITKYTTNTAIHAQPAFADRSKLFFVISWARVIPLALRYSPVAATSSACGSTLAKIQRRATDDSDFGVDCAIAAAGLSTICADVIVGHLAVSRLCRLLRESPRWFNDGDTASLCSSRLA